MQKINQPDSPKQLTHWVADQLRQRVLEGAFKPGEWMRQQRLATALGISQMPVREALKELVSEGLLEYVPYRGVRVQSYSIEDVEDLYTHRGFLEGIAAWFTTTRLTDLLLNELVQLQSQMESHTSAADLQIYRELNRKFHEMIYQSCGRVYLIRTLNQMWAAFPNMLWSNFPQTATASLPDRDIHDAAEHRAILAGLRDRNPDQAQKAMEHHISMARDHLIQSLREQQ